MDISDAYWAGGSLAGVADERFVCLQVQNVKRPLPVREYEIIRSLSETQEH